MSSRNRPILITGAPRSGTTWVGRMVAAHPRVLYFSEPYNSDRRDLPVPYTWYHTTEADAEAFRRYLRPYFELRFSVWEDRQDFPCSRPYRLVRGLAFLGRRLLGCRPLVKDPTAFFSAEWLAREYDARVVVLIRHPAAFASSLKRLNWQLPFHDLLAQPELLRRYLGPYEEAIRRMCSNGGNLIAQAILGWNLLHHVVRGYRERHPDWIFCRHEDLSLRPVEGFADLCGRLGLDFGPSLRATVERHTSEENPREAGGKVHQLKRNSAASIWNWQERLTPDEVARIRAGTRELAGEFYTESDWQVPEDLRAAA